MEPNAKREIELTGDLIDYCKRSAFKLAKQRCPPHISPWDVSQRALLQLIARPPKYDPTKGASEKTLLYIALQCLVSKGLDSEYKHARRFKQTGQMPDEYRREEEPPVELKLDAILRFIDCQESRALCRHFVECNGNKSMVAKRMGISEGTVRYRIGLLAPKLLAAGFNPRKYGVIP